MLESDVVDLDSGAAILEDGAEICTVVFSESTCTVLGLAVNDCWAVLLFLLVDIISRLVFTDVVDSGTVVKFDAELVVFDFVVVLVVTIGLET